MGKKKSFIDKKKAVTYSLVYRDPSEDPEGEDGGERTLAPVGGHRGGAQLAADDYPEYYDEDGSVYDSEYSLAMSRSAAAHHDSSYAMSEERRRELLALGFPDDGYDYLRHMRDLGRGRPPPGGKAGVATIPEDQELDGFGEEDVEGGEWQEGSDNEEDFTIYEQPEPAAAGSAGAGPSSSAAAKKLDAAALAAAEAAAEAAAAAGPSTSAGGGSRAAASAAAGPGPGSARAAAAAAARSAVARSVATTARTQGSAVGPSVYVPAARLMAPKADVKVVDARRLVVRPKGHDEAAAAAALGEVTAMARHTELHGTRGKLYQDLDEVEKSMVAIENGVDSSRKEVVEGDEWADWLDEFVAGGGDDEGGGGAAAASGGTGAIEQEDEDEVDVGGSSEEPEEEDEDADEWRMRHRRQQQQGQGQGQVGTSAGDAAAAAAGPARAAPGDGGAGVGAASVASSYWRRPERRDRREGFEALDAQFERLAVEYDDDEIGALDDGRYDDDEDEGEDEDEDEKDGAVRRKAGRVGGAGAGAAGNCELSDFADVLDEFLNEHRASEALEAEGLKQLAPTDDVSLQASRPDPEALAATRARMRRQMEAEAAAAAAGGAGAGADDVPVRTIVVQEAERWDCESILSLTSNLENHPGKIVEPQRRTGSGRGGGLIRLSAKTGMPVTRGAARAGTNGTLGAPAGATIPEEAEGEEAEEEEGAAGSQSEDSEGCGGSVLDPALLSRRKGETAEERKARKAAVKEARRNQRTAKKEMKTMFRQQATRAQKQSAGRSQAAGSTYVIP